MAVQLIDATLPDFGVPATRPDLPRATYLSRLDALNKARRAAGIDSLLIYADREHAANLAWLTGFDPRFEEALLILAPGQTPTLLAGPENLGRAQKASIEVEARLYPPFGLMGQDRSQTPELEEVLTSAGVARNQRVGVIGWKYFGPSESPRPDAWFETPAFIIDTLRHIVGPEGRAVNANALLMDASTGLRAVNEIEQIAQFEFGAVAASEALKALFRAARPGMSEFAAVQSMGLGVLPHSCHTMLSTGGRLSGLESPSGKIIERGDPITTAVGYPGGLSSRVVWMVADSSELPAGAEDWLERLAMPYFACAAEWYATLGIGVTGGPQASGRALLQPHPQSRPSDPPRRVDEHAGLSQFARGAAVGPGHTVRHHSGRRPALPLRQHRGRRCAARPARPRRAARQIPGRGGAGRGASRLHGRRAGDQAEAGNHAAFESGRGISAFPAAPGPASGAALISPPRGSVMSRALR